MKISNVQFKWGAGYPKRLTTTADNMIKQVAKMTLDASIPITPMSATPGHSGTLRKATIGFHGLGVIGSNGVYQIGSATDYASKVYVYPDSTNWTTPGTGNQWFAKTWKRRGKSISKIAISKYKLK